MAAHVKVETGGYCCVQKRYGLIRTLRKCKGADGRKQIEIAETVPCINALATRDFFQKLGEIIFRGRQDFKMAPVAKNFLE